MSLNDSVDKIPGIGGITKRKLISAGIIYIKDVLMFSPARLAELTGISEETAEKVIKNAIKYLEKKEAGFSFIEASKIDDKIEVGKFLHTGSKKFDKILGGGYASKTITELCGEYRSGKTQCCLTATVTAFLPPDQGGLCDESPSKMTVVFIDTEQTFTKKRILEIAKRFELKENILDSILVGRPLSAYHQMQMINDLVKLVKRRNVKLVIVDSLTRLPRADFEGRGELYARQRLILAMVEKLKRLAQLYDIVVIITNQVMSRPDMFFGGHAVPIGGHVLAHNVDTRVMLIVKKDPIRVARIVDSAWLPPAECEIRITSQGITD